MLKPGILLLDPKETISKEEKETITNNLKVWLKHKWEQEHPNSVCSNFRYFSATIPMVSKTTEMFRNFLTFS